MPGLQCGLPGGRLVLQHPRLAFLARRRPPLICYQVELVDLESARDGKDFPLRPSSWPSPAGSSSGKTVRRRTYLRFLCPNAACLTRELSSSFPLPFLPSFLGSSLRRPCMPTLTMLRTECACRLSGYLRYLSAIISLSRCLVSLSLKSVLSSESSLFPLSASLFCRAKT